MKKTQVFLDNATTFGEFTFILINAGREKSITAALGFNRRAGDLGATGYYLGKGECAVFLGWYDDLMKEPLPLLFDRFAVAQFAISH